MKKITIIGGGIAGTFLAAHFLEKGKAVTLIEKKQPGSASQVAAGLYNVITGRFGSKSWMAETLLPTLKSFLAKYPFLDPYHSPSMIYRPFKEISEYNKWTGRVEDPAYRDWVKFQESPLLPDVIHNEEGGIQVTPCGWVDVPGAIAAFHEYFSTLPNFQLISQHLPYEDIDLKKKEVNIYPHPISFDQLFFCEGYQASKNPFFQGIPIIPNKGEILVIESPDLQLDFVLSRKVYVIPQVNNQYVVGSTYQNQFETLHPTEAAKNEIIGHLEKAIKPSFKVLDHRAGIRPTTPDRKPILGTHHEHSFVHICTGFGTKGLLLGPYFTQMLADSVMSAQDGVQESVRNIIPEVSLKRFQKKYNLK